MEASSIQCKVCSDTDINNFRSRIVSGKTYYIKTCRRCESSAALVYFNAHKEERAEYQKKYISENKEIIKYKKKKYDKVYYENNKEELLDYQKDYAKNNRDKITERQKNRRKNEPEYKLRCSISGRIHKILNKFGHKKKTSCIKHLEFTFKQLKEHISSQFEPWMNWDNQGIYSPKTWKDDDSSTWCWQLDHIVPQSDLPYTSMEDENFKKCWALNNLRPLSAKQNLLDGTSRKRHSK